MDRIITGAIAATATLLTAISCNRTSWTDAERDIICNQDCLMRVLTIDNPEDSLFLRGTSGPLSAEDIGSDTFKTLSGKMIVTVTSPEQDGVGIAGPQVGIARRVVAVQRFDKPGEPFEVYPNIRITAHEGEQEPGPEGCLSVPGRRGEVNRWQKIDISYTSPSSLRDTSETVEGFSAVIFQHETDHLDGILYIDRIQ